MAVEMQMQLHTAMAFPTVSAVQSDGRVRGVVLDRRNVGSVEFSPVQTSHADQGSAKRRRVVH